ncbi:vascular cell adhesion protein 1 isoform X2 [Hyla sarda]|uniref:vascular cell adhesion protein 1 isoform X2 n=1 Tax=Hyla sarda TaxID=327740 RepID=UPI0024C39D93|nr:vascular cell adhesion protein 1 isoform X2 [Hyla sarda]
MAKSRTPTSILLMLCSQIFFMHTSAMDITLLAPQTQIQSQIGEELHITCLATKCGNNDPMFTWSSLEDKTLSGTVVTREKTSILTMKVDAETEGSFRCTVSCDNPPVEKSLRLTVYSFPSDPILQISSLVVGQSSQITCLFQNVYPAEMLIAQILLGEEIVATNDREDYEFPYSGMENVSLSHNLTLTEEMDQKEMRCEASLETSDPVRKLTAQKLNLIYPPEEPHIVVQPSETVKAGEEIHLLCSSNSKSQTEVRWVKRRGEEEDEIRTEDPGTLILANAEPNDGGVYICHSENSAGKASSQVEINVYGVLENPTLTIQPGTRVEAGQAVMIECTAGGDTNVTLQMMSEDGDVLYVYSEGKTTIDEADPKDAAEYKCTAKNLYGVTETSQYLTVEYSPRQTVLSSSPSEVNEGDTVNLTCTSMGVPAPSISIYKLLTSGENVLLSEGPEVTLSNVTSGIYQCRAENRLGTDKDKMELMVRVPPKNTVITITPTHTVKEGENVHIRCTSEAFPAPKLALRMKTELGITELEAENGHYDIIYATVDHSGTYICESSNVIGRQISQAALTVQVPPRNTHVSITPSSVVREGDSVQIRCTSEASPAPRLVLKMIMGHGVVDLVSESGDYNISNAGVEHTGTYICESTNAAGSEMAEGTLNVEVAPKNTYIEIIPSPFVIEGDSVQIRCSSEGSPDPKLVLKMRSEDEPITLESSDGSYNITHVGIENAGTYICESANVVGQELALGTLTVQVPPRNTTVVVTPSQNIKEGDTVTITCETHSIPSPTIILQKVCAKNNTLLQSTNGTFTLHNVTTNDTGTYTLKIISSAGNETEVINIVVAAQESTSPRFNLVPLYIFGSVAFISAGAIASIVYHLKKSKVQGSYSLVKALRSKV